VNEIRKWANEINPDDLPEPYRTIAYKASIQSAIELAEMYQGTHIYLPKLDGTIKTLRDRKIKKEFTGYNYKELALKYNLSEIWIRQIIEADKNQDQITIDDILKSKGVL